MRILVAYDVKTETREGRRRLRRVAKCCLNYGQRVQLSLFECQLNEMQFENLERALLAEIDCNEDNLRLYRLPENYQKHVREYGVFRAIDFEGVLVI